MHPWGPELGVKKGLPRAGTGSELRQMKAPEKQSSPGSAASDKQPAKAQPEQDAPATLGQKIFIVVLYLYVLSLVWLTLSHHWYGVLPKWLDPYKPDAQAATTNAVTR
jgi:hypothetical protein